MMRTQTLEIEAFADQLLVVLDRDIRHLESTLTTLDQLRRFVVMQNNHALNQLLGNIQSQAKEFRENESNRQALRKELAVIFGCHGEQLTLSRIASRLAQEKKTEIVKRQNKLRTLTALMKKEHLTTQVLLSDCARFNRTLLKTIFETGQSKNITYKPTGNTERQTDTVFMNIQF